MRRHRINTASQIEAAVGAGGKYGGVFKAPAPLTAGVWHHVALTYDGVEVRAYLDGASLGSQAVVAGPIEYGPFPMLIGADFGASPVADHFPGQIDQVAIWAGVVTSEAIQRLYNKGNGITLP